MRSVDTGADIPCVVQIILAVVICHPGARARLIASGALDWLAERVAWLGPVVQAVKDLHHRPFGGWPSDLYDYPGVWDLRLDVGVCGRLWTNVIYKDGLEIQEFMDLLFPADSKDLETATAVCQGEPHRRAKGPKVVRLLAPAEDGHGEGVSNS